MVCSIRKTTPTIIAFYVYKRSLSQLQYWMAQKLDPRMGIYFFLYSRVVVVERAREGRRGEGEVANGCLKIHNIIINAILS